MARNNNLRSNRGARSSQLVSEQQEAEAGADEFLDDQEGADAEDIVSEEKIARLEDAVLRNSSFCNQQESFNQKLSARMDDLQLQLSSKMEIIMQEIKNLKSPDQGTLGTGSREGREKTRTGAGESNRNDQSNGYLPPHRRNVEFSGEFQSISSFGNSSTQRNSFFSNQKLVQPKSLRLDFPSFSGAEDVIAWLEQTAQIFEYYDIKEDEWVKVCSFYLRGEALQWYRWLTRNIDNYQYWSVFKEELMTRFGPSELSRPYDVFSTMKQTSTVREYLGKFEQTLGLLEDQPSRRHILERFIGGLKDELRFEVAAGRPSSLKETVSLAKLFEDKQRNEKRSKGNWNVFNQGNSYNRTLPEVPVQDKSKFPQFKKLTPEDIQKKRSQNHEKWHRGHQGKGKHIFILEGVLECGTEEEIEDHGCNDQEDLAIELAESLVRGAPSISVQALSGITASHTIRVVGYYKNQAISILIDSGSTHNFVNSKLVKRLGLPVTEYSNFDVLVASGELIKGDGVCQGVSLDCQGVSIQVNLLVMPLGGSQIVLGADWMKTLEDITLNFKKLQVTFLCEGVKRTLQGIIPGELQLVSEKDIAKSVREQKEGYLIQLCSVNLQEPVSGAIHEELPADINSLVQEFDVIFQELPHLPPAREIDHKIPLETRTKPVCIRPYRHAHFLKEEIEKQIEEMLEKGIIRHSHSPFSSPVVMVKKSDGS
ncbi:uncharacterized protein LOC109841679 [Asparagus officinalis]|uniref:uncharacterized protein LOC109841679 n=1 Tax=Asparagus officinalis TaxID=4686 RepID=UPI00098E7B1F|nr:uncharacterized protein LOC109841679 [Asparagus officinalis]